MRRAKELLTHWPPEQQRIVAQELLIALEGGKAAERMAELPKEAVPTARVENHGAAEPGKPMPREQAEMAEGARVLLERLSGELRGVRPFQERLPDVPRGQRMEKTQTEAAAWLPLPGKMPPERVAVQDTLRFEERAEMKSAADQYREMQRISQWFERDSRSCDPGFIRY